MFGACSKCPYLEGIDLHIRFHVLEDVLEHLEREDLFALHGVCRSQSGSCCCCCLRNTHFSKESCGGSYSQPYSRSFARTQYLLLYCRKRTALFSFRFPLYSLFIDFAQKHMFLFALLRAYASSSLAVSFRLRAFPPLRALRALKRFQYEI